MSLVLISTPHTQPLSYRLSLDSLSLLNQPHFHLLFSMLNKQISTTLNSKIVAIPQSAAMVKLSISINFFHIVSIMLIDINTN